MYVELQEDWLLHVSETRAHILLTSILGRYATQRWEIQDYLHVDS